MTGTAAKWPTDGGVVPEAFAPMSVSLPKRWVGERRAVAAALADERFDVAVTHFAPYAFGVLGKITAGRRPLVAHFQGPWAQESRAEGGGRMACEVKARIERTVYRRARRLIVLSTPFKDILVRDYGVSPDRVRVVPGGVDCQRFEVPQTRDEARVKLGWPAGRPTVLTVRRLTPRMGLENLIEAAVDLRRAVPEILIHIAGGGKQRATLEEAITRRGLGGTVRLLGFVPDNMLPLAYRAADLTVVPTVALEGFGLVAAESLAAGTPALATPVDGLVDLLGPLSPGLLFAGASAGDVARGLSAALGGPVGPADAVGVRGLRSPAVRLVRYCRRRRGRVPRCHCSTVKAGRVLK